jgi:hypothetical protein
MTTSTKSKAKRLSLQAIIDYAAFAFMGTVVMLSMAPHVLFVAMAICNHPRPGSQSAA